MRSRKMSENWKMLMIGVSLMALFFAVNPANAVTPNPPGHHETWTGIQVIGQPFDDYSVDIKYHGNVMIITVSGLRMNTVSGYEFDGITVAYERIDDLTIIMTPKGIPYPILPPLQPLMYLFPHNGKITWYDAYGNVVGTGTFGSRGGNVGSLVVNGPGLHVKGEYGLWVGNDPYLVGHIGWYIITNDGK